MKKKAQQQYQGNQQHYKSSVPEGETVIDRQQRNEQKSKSSVGEYVDFEEID